MSSNENSKSAAGKYPLDHVFARCKNDSAYRASLRKADNPDTEYQSWEYLADFKVNLEYADARLPYTTVFAAIARSDRNTDGNLALGSSICMAYDGDRESQPARAKLRRILACDTLEEVCSVLRPLLRFIGSKGIALSYSQLLSDLRFFNKSADKIKARWAQQFFGKQAEEGNA